MWKIFVTTQVHVKNCHSGMLLGRNPAFLANYTMDYSFLTEFRQKHAGMTVY